jgi:hypothetical protein
MEAVGAAAGVAGLVELAAKIGSVCFQYSTAVKHASGDIQRLQKEVNGLQGLLEHVKQLFDGPNAIKLTATQSMKDGIETCESTLQALNQELSPSKTRTFISRLNTRALKWPLQSAEVDKFLRRLDGCRQSISVALQVDHT